MMCAYCGERDGETCRECAGCEECCECDEFLLNSDTFDLDEFGMEPEDEYERRTR